MTTTPAAWSRAREEWEGGASNRVAGLAAGISGEAVRRRAHKDGWERRTAALEEAARQRALQTNAAAEEARRRWANRRATEADAAGLTASVARQRVAQAMQDGDPTMTKAASVAYGIFIDKAQLLSGAATSRIDEVRDPKAHALGLLDELAARREAHAR